MSIAPPSTASRHLVLAVTIATVSISTICCTKNGNLSQSQDKRRSSPDGQFFAEVIEGPDPGFPGTTAWYVTIRRAADGVISYRDGDGFVRTALNTVRWRWDEDNRLWLYNTDDGRTWYWQRQGEQWHKHELVEGSPGDPSPPPGIE